MILIFEGKMKISSILFLVLFFAACDSSNSPEVISPPDDSTPVEKTIMKSGEEIFPVEVDNFWEYEFKAYTEDKLDFDGKTTYKFSEKGNYQYENENREGYKLEIKRFEKDYVLETAYVYSKNQEGLFIEGEITQEGFVCFSPKRQLFKSDIQAGTEWSYTTSQGKIVKLLCESTEDEYFVNDKKYKSIRIRKIYDENYYRIINYVKGIGMVKTTHHHSFANVKLRFEYNLVHNVLK